MTDDESIAGTLTENDHGVAEHRAHVLVVAAKVKHRDAARRGLQTEQPGLRVRGEHLEHELRDVVRRGPVVRLAVLDDDEAYDAEALINTSDRRVPCLRAKEPNIIVRGDCRERAETVTRPFVKMIA